MDCIIVEDQPPAQRILKKYIGDIGHLELKATFTDAIQALEFLRQNKVELIFLDVHLPKISGIDFLKTLHEPSHIILTTAFPDYALKSYEFDVVDYLLKPFSFQRFVKAVSKVPAKTSLSVAQSEHLPREIFIKSGYEYIKIQLDELLYIKSDADYTELFLPNKKQLSSESLRYWSTTLDPQQFAQIHKSFIINTHKVIKITSAQVEMEDGKVLPIGRRYKDDFLKRLI